MKNITSIIIGFLVAIFLVAVAGYFGLPYYLKAATADIAAGLKGLDERVRKVETFIKKEEERRATNQLAADANRGQIINRINATIARLETLEATMKKMETAVKGEIAKVEDNSKTAWDKLREGFADQAKSIEKASMETDRLGRRMALERNILLVRSRILRARMELSLKNLDTAKKELDLAAELFAKAGVDRNPAWKKSFEDIQDSFRKTKMEIDLNLPAAIQRMDLLWHDLDLFPGT